jgi:hypothetical protein
MLTPPINESGAELTRGGPLVNSLFRGLSSLSLILSSLWWLVLSDRKITHLQIHIGHDPIVGHRPRVLRLCYLHAHQVPLTSLQIS